MEREQWISRVQQALNTMLTIDEKMEIISERQKKLQEFPDEVDRRKRMVCVNLKKTRIWLVASVISFLFITIMGVVKAETIWLVLLFADIGLIYAGATLLQKENENSDEMRIVLKEAKQEELAYQAAVDWSKKDLENYIASSDVEELQKTIPEAYATMDAVVFFLSVLQNMRADNLKEAINLYEEELHKRQMLDLQQQEMDLLKKSIKLSQAQLKTQEQMAKSQAEIQRRAEKLSKQVRFGNVFQVVNTVRHWNS